MLSRVGRVRVAILFESFRVYYELVYFVHRVCIIGTYESKLTFAQHNSTMGSPLNEN